jgi:hypothetical protein
LRALFTDALGSLNPQYLRPGKRQEVNLRGRGYGYSGALVAWLGQSPGSRQAQAQPPYPHYAAATQALVETCLTNQITHTLSVCPATNQLVVAAHHLDCLAGGYQGLLKRLQQRFPNHHILLDPFPRRVDDARHLVLYHQWLFGFRGFTGF